MGIVHTIVSFLYRGQGEIYFTVAYTRANLVRYSILPALCLDRILHVSIFNHAIYGDEFCLFIAGLLEHMQPWPLLKSVLIMDNAAIHSSFEPY